MVSKGAKNEDVHVIPLGAGTEENQQTKRPTVDLDCQLHLKAPLGVRFPPTE
jgi:hypothetical protein